MVIDYSNLVKKAYQDAGNKYAASPQQHSRGRDSQLHQSQDIAKSRSQQRLEPSRNANQVAASYAYGQDPKAYYGAE